MTYKYILIPYKRVMIIPLLQVNGATLPPPPDCINESVYQCDIPVQSAILNENHVLLGHRGVYSYRPTSRSSGAIELKRPDNTTTRFHAVVKYQLSELEFIVYDNTINWRLD